MTLFRLPSTQDVALDFDLPPDYDLELDELNAMSPSELAAEAIAQATPAERLEMRACLEAWWLSRREV